MILPFFFIDWFSPIDTSRSLPIRKFVPATSVFFSNTGRHKLDLSSYLISKDTFSPSGVTQTPNVNHNHFPTEIIYYRRQRTQGQSRRETEKTAGRLTNKITETLTPRKLWTYPRTLSHSPAHMSKQGRRMKIPSIRSVLGFKMHFGREGWVFSSAKELHWMKMNTVDDFNPEMFGLQSENSEETLLKPIQSAGSINLIYSRKMFVYPAWKQQLLWIPLPTFGNTKN